MTKYILLLFAPLMFSAQGKYSVDSIPSHLLKEADAVIRLDKTVFTIKGPNSGETVSHFIVTVFNERGRDQYLRQSTLYNKYIKIKQIKGCIYDKNGNVIYRLKRKNSFDYKFGAYSNGISDSKEKITEFDSKSYEFPYTLEFYSTTITRNMMFYPREYFGGLERISIQEKTLKIESPINFAYRIKETNLPQAQRIQATDKTTSRIWTVKNLPPQEYSLYKSPYDNPIVETAPKKLKFEHYSAEINSWNDIGNFCASLNKGRDFLNPEQVQKIRKLVETETDTLKKIEILYAYLQQTTHYQSIQLGIGGWQTIPVNTIASNGYGDCKALSYYMKAILGAVGIDSHVALVKAGDFQELADPDFPTFYFNHMINCIPFHRDTIWLECTSQTDPIGFLGSFTGNRTALLVLPNGGKLVETKRYTHNDNVQIRTAQLTITESGSAEAKISTNYFGVKLESKNYVANKRNYIQQKTILENSLNLPSFSLKRFYFIEHKLQIPNIEEYLELDISGVLNKSGSLAFLKPNRFSERLLYLQEENVQKSSLYLNPNWFEFTEIDSITYILPTNYKLETLPEKTIVNSIFGEYISEIMHSGSTLKYYRKLVHRSGTFPPEDRSAWFEFINKINKSDQVVLAFKKT